MQEHYVAQSFVIHLILAVTQKLIYKVTIYLETEEKSWQGRNVAGHLAGQSTTPKQPNHP